MKKLKDTDLSRIPAPLAAMLRDIIPEDADVEIDLSDPNFGVISMTIGDGVTDSCSGVGCKNCEDCPAEEQTTVNLTEPVQIIANAYARLATLVRLNGDVSHEERKAAADALSNISDAADYALEILEGGY